MKHKCNKCGRKFPRMDVWNVGSVKRKLLGSKKLWICRYCMNGILGSEYSRNLWICAHCRPPQKFTDRDEYIRHHLTGHP